MTIVSRIRQIIEYKQVSERRFCIKIGVSNGFLSKVKDIGSEKVKKIVDAYPEISTNWLITGKGDMLKKEELNKNIPLAKKSKKSKGIPLITIGAMAGFGRGDQLVMECECEHYVIPLLHDAQFLIRIAGSSMIPKYSSGDIVACKKLSLNDIFFQWNKIYVLDTDQGALIKRIKPGSDKQHIKCVSENSNYDPFELSLTQIHSLALVIGVVHLE